MVQQLDYSSSDRLEPETHAEPADLLRHSASTVEASDFAYGVEATALWL